MPRSTARPCEYLLNCRRKPPLTFNSTQINQTASPLLRLPAELRNKIFQSSIVQKKFILDDPSQVLVPVMSNVGLLSSCRQINHEVAGLVPYSPVLRLGEYVCPCEFFPTDGEDGGFGKYRINQAVQVLEITNVFLKLFSTDYLDFYINDDHERKWLPEIFPNLKPVEVYDCGGLDSQVEILKEPEVDNFRLICYGVDAERSCVEVVLI
jgi:hypothetical protein